MKRLLHSLSLFATLAFLSACPVPSSGPQAVSADRGDATETPPPEAPPPAAPEPTPVFAMRADKGPGGGDATEATPTWTPSSAGSVGCLAAEVIVPVSLEDRSPMWPGSVGVTVSVRNPETGAREALAGYDLATSFLLRDPSGNLIEEGNAGLFKSLEVGVRVFTSDVPRTIVGATAPLGPTCEEVWEGILQKRFVLSFSYVKKGAVYRGAPRDDIAFLPPEQPPLVLGGVVLRD